MKKVQFFALLAAVAMFSLAGVAKAHDEGVSVSDDIATEVEVETHGSLDTAGHASFEAEDESGVDINDAPDDSDTDQDEEDSSGPGRGKIFMHKLEDRRPTLLDNLSEKHDLLEDRGMTSGDVRGHIMNRGIDTRTTLEVRQHIGERFDVAITNLKDNIIPRLESRIDKMKEAGVDVGDADEDLASAKLAIDAASDDWASLKALFESETPSKEEVKAAAEALKTSLTDVKDSLKGVLDMLRSISVDAKASVTQ